MIQRRGKVERTAQTPYQRLEHPSCNIRLISLSGHQKYGVECHLKHVYTPKLAPTFIAASYTWGDPVVCRTILLNGCKFGVRENLYQFLMHILRARSSKDAKEKLSKAVSCKQIDHTLSRDGNHMQYCPSVPEMRDPSAWNYFWIDALCIDQSSLEEKSSQLPLMAEIYQSAKFVLSWLGVEADGSSEAMRFMASNHHYYRNCHPSQRECPNAPVFINWNKLDRTAVADEAFLSSVPRKAIQALFARAFWSRLWIIQEFVLANDIMFMCGDALASVSAIIEYMQFCNPHWQSTNRGNSNESDSQTEESPLLVLVDYRYHTDRSWSTLKERPLLYEMLQGFQDWQCSEPKDRIYGMLGMAHSQLKANYRFDNARIFEDVLEEAAFEYLNDHDIEDPRWQKICDIMITAFGLDAEGATRVGKEILREEWERQNPGGDFDDDLLAGEDSDDDSLYCGGCLERAKQCSCAE